MSTKNSSHNLGLTQAMGIPHTHALLAGLRDEFPLTVDAGVGPLSGNVLLPLRHIARRRGASTRVLGA